MATSKEIGDVGVDKIKTGSNFKRHAKDAETLREDQKNTPLHKLLELDPENPTITKRSFSMLYFTYWELKQGEILGTEPDLSKLQKISPNDMVEGFDERRIAAIGLERKIIGGEKDENGDIKSELLLLFSHRMSLYGQRETFIDEKGNEVAEGSEGAVPGHAVDWPTINPAVSPLTLTWPKHESINNSIIRMGSMEAALLSLRDNTLESGIEGERALYSTLIPPTEE